MKPIAMKCSQEQYKEIRPILLENGFKDNSYSEVLKGYLVNNSRGRDDCIGFFGGIDKSYSRAKFEEWNKDIFLEHCDIDTFKLPKKWWVKRNCHTAKVINEYLNTLMLNSKYGWEPGHSWDAVHSEPVRDTTYKYTNNGRYEDSIVSGFTEITFEQFKKYVLKKQKSMRKLTIPITDVLEIHAMACRDWKNKIAAHLARVDENQNITFSEEDIQEGFRAADLSQRDVLVRIFGEKDQYKEDDWVLLSNDANGWGRASSKVNNKVLQITRIDFDDQENEGGRYYFGDETTVGKCIVRLATPEEIKEAQKPVIEWDKLKTGSKVKIRKTGSECGYTSSVDFDEPVDIVFLKTPHLITSDGKFLKSGSSSSYCTFHQNGKFILFTSITKINYITEVIEY